MTSCDLFLVLLARKIKGAVPAVPAVASVPSPFQSTGRIRDGADGAYGALGPAELIPDNHENRHGIPLHILFTHILSTQRLLKLRCNISESQQDPEFFSWNTFHSNMSGVMISEMQKKIMSTRCIVLWILYQGSLLLANEPLGYVRRDGITNQFPTSQGRIVFWS